MAPTGSSLERAGRIARNGALLVRNSLTRPPETRRKPLVSVILTTYNWSSVLRHSVRSVLEQTYENFELIVVGDACTDDSEQVVCSFGDPRVRWDNLAENSGNQAAPNSRGLVLARGELIAYQGHDDVWHPYHLATLVDGLESGGADLVWTVAEVRGPRGSRVRALSGRLSRSRRELGWWIPTCTVMYTRELATRTGPWPDWRQSEQPVDIEMMDQAQRAGARMRAIPALTAFKFPSALRPNSYREQPSHEQAEYMRRIASRRAFRVREIAATLASQLSPLPERLPEGFPRATRMAPGEITRRARRIRGLD